MSVIKSKLLSEEYVYDFAVDGGAIGNIDLSAKEGYKLLPAGAIVQEVHSWVETACTSGGSATVSWGDGSDVDGYSGTAKAVAALTLNAAFAGAGALVPSYAVNEEFTVSIAVAALTAGKVRFIVSYYLPA